MNAALDYIGNDAAKTELRSIADAVQKAMRTLLASHEWKYYRDTQIQPLNATVLSTGTVAYVNSTRLVTWNTTLPSWFGPGCAMVGASNNVYIVQEVPLGSTTTFVLNVGSNPGSDTTYDSGALTLAQFAFDLPLDFWGVISCGMSNGSFLTMIPIASGDMAEYRRRNFVTGTPRMYDIIGSKTTAGRMAMNVWPIPNDNQALSVFYKRKPRVLRIRDYSIGTITATAASRTITGNGTAWDQSMVGSMIRLTDTAEAPTSYGDTNPYLEELMIDSVTNATTLVTTSAPNLSYTKRKYVISDPVDIHEGMANYLYRLVEKEVRLIKRMALVGEEMQALQYAKIEAMEVDNMDIAGTPGYPMWLRAPLYLYRNTLG